MMLRDLRIAAVLAVAIVGLALFGQSSLPSGDNEAHAQQPAQAGAQRGGAMRGMSMPGMQQQAAKEVTNAICIVHPLGDSKVTGKVTFTKQADGVLVEAEITGLTPGDHGFHVHEWGDCSSPDGLSAGSHFNPTGADHGRPEADERHAGDFGNITADATGKASYSRVDKKLELNGPNSIIGRSIILHADPDDFSQPVGNAGGRVACGVIGIAKPAAAN